MRSLLQDARYGVRMLAKSPGFTAVAVLAIALGIGANTTIFTLVNSFLLRPLPFEHPEQLVIVRDIRTPGGTRQTRYSDYENWKRHSTVFENFATFRYENFNVSGSGEPERIEGLRVPAGFFPMLRVKPVLGRLFREDEDSASASPVVLISSALWRRRFASSAGVIGREIVLNGVAHTIIGVIPPDFRFPDPICQVWTPLGAAPDLARYAASYALPVGRLKPGVGLAAAKEELTAIVRTSEAPGSRSNAWNARVMTLAEAFSSGPSSPLRVMYAAVVFVLLIACANVVNLMLARAAGRTKEIAIRMALGAGRFRIIRQTLVESALLAALGGLLGLLIAMWGVNAILSAIPARLLPWIEVRLDGTVLAYAAGAALLSGLVFGLAPALQASGGKLNEALKSGGRTSTAGAGRARLRSAFVICEIAPALMLLIGAGLLLKSFLRIQSTDPGFRIDDVLTMELSLTESRYPKPGQRAAFYSQAVERIGSLPGVRSAGAAVRHLTRVPVQIAGRPAPGPGESFPVFRRTITLGYFPTLDVRMLRGRNFTASDIEGATAAAIINEKMASRFWPGEDPVGRQLKLAGAPQSPWLTVVGVCADQRQDLRAEAVPEVFLPHAQDASATMMIYMRTASDPMSIAPAAQAEIRSLDRDQPVSSVQTLRQLLSFSLVQHRVPSVLIAIFAAVALLLSASGLYGVVSYSVSRRTHEIGVRLTLGAGRKDVVLLALRQGMTLALTGTAIGLTGAFAVSRILAALLIGVSPRDPAVFSGTAVLLGAVAVLASYIPARRAAAVDPIVALRSE